MKMFWPVQISNEELWARAKQKPIELEIRQRKWRWLGHTLRRQPGDIAKAALEWNPQGTRTRGRPRTTWRRTIFEEIRHQGKTWNEVKVLASNRVRWRNFVRALCSLVEWRETIYIYTRLTHHSQTCKLITCQPGSNSVLNLMFISCTSSPATAQEHWPPHMTTFARSSRYELCDL